MAGREPVWHDDAWFEERGFMRPLGDWDRRQDEATLRKMHDSVRAAPRLTPEQILGLRRIFGDIRRQAEARERTAADDPFRPQAVPTGCP